MQTAINYLLSAFFYEINNNFIFFVVELVENFSIIKLFKNIHFSNNFPIYLQLILLVKFQKF